MMAAVAATARSLYGFSRGTQALMSTAQPLVAALVALPEPSAERLGLLMAFAVTALPAGFGFHDLLDLRLDRPRFRHLRSHEGFDLDTAGARHPVAQGLLPLASGVLWTAGLGLAALVLSVALGWVCTALFAAALLLGAAYSRLATVTPYKTLLLGAAVSLWGCTGWFAVGADIDPPRLALLAVWLAAWEIGGRNLPNDLADTEEDARLGIATVAVVHGRSACAAWSCAALAVAAAAGAALMAVAFPVTGAIGLGAAVLAGCLLVAAGLRLVRRPDPATAQAVFNVTSLHPVLVLAGVLTAHALSGA
ncbi:UbiA family prenyltransferase [Actinomadura sp. 21ATH]|uniref:UbiA family prenyltransferase n=1 Tax=Actinomadura sp. 21ATH TaxID=1735444 RepID=UPI0035C24F4A